MIKVYRCFCYALFFVFLMGDNMYPWELYDRVIAVVNEVPIIESEIEQKFDRAVQTKKIAKSKYSFEKSRILDKYIEEALVLETAARESIIVSEEKVDNHIDKIMKRTGIATLDAFKKQVEKTENITFSEYREELKNNLVAQDVVSIAIGVSPPTQEEARAYYQRNKDKVGFEVNIDHIFLKMKSDTFEENKQVYKEIKGLYNRINKGEDFGAVARQNSDDPSAKENSGSLGWVALSDIAQRDMIYANNIYQEFVMGKSRLAIIKSSSGYHIVKYRGKRATSFDGAKDEIMNVLYQMKQAEQFKRWVYRRRLESDVKIYMEDYVKEKNL